jgi:MFS family permease
VIAVYTGVLAAALPSPRTRAVRVHPGFPRRGGLALFAAGSLGCALAGSLAVMLDDARRSGRRRGGGDRQPPPAMLRADERRDAAWSTIAIAGAAAGPALGGALTQAFDWHAIFVAQVPIALAAAAGCAWAAESHSLDAPAATAEAGARTAVGGRRPGARVRLAHRRAVPPGLRPDRRLERRAAGGRRPR